MQLGNFFLRPKPTAIPAVGAVLPLMTWQTLAAGDVFAKGQYSLWPTASFLLDRKAFLLGANDEAKTMKGDLSHTAYVGVSKRGAIADRDMCSSRYNLSILRSTRRVSEESDCIMWEPHQDDDTDLYKGGGCNIANPHPKQPKAHSQIPQKQPISASAKTKCSRQSSLPSPSPP